jgi:hypothetical protein
MVVDRKTLAALLCAVALGWWLASSPASPVRPEPIPARPVLRGLAKLTALAARWGLFVALAAEESPVSQSVLNPQREPEGRQGIVQAPAVDSAGHRVLNHREGW